MDYKYIEQLVERYWQCDTSLEEEAILKAFFSQANVPEHLMPYKSLFAGEKMQQEAKLDESFDAQVLERIQEDETVKAKRVSITRRLMPFYKAAASIAIILTLGNAAQNSFRPAEAVENDYNYENYNQISDALQMVSQSLSEASKQDSLLREQVGNQPKGQ